MLASIVALAFFLYLAWACSYDKDYEFNFIGLSLQNDSDSCTVTDISLIYRVRRDNDDTLSLPGYELAPGDTVLLDLERLNYKELGYTCNCPNDTTLHTADVSFDSLYYQSLNIDCD